MSESESIIPQLSSKEIIEDAKKTSLGHRLEDGTLDPDKEDQEILNKVLVLEQNAEDLRADSSLGEVLEVLYGRFGGNVIFTGEIDRLEELGVIKKDEVAEWMEGNS